MYIMPGYILTLVPCDSNTQGLNYWAESISACDRHETCSTANKSINVASFNQGYTISFAVPTMIACL